MEIKVLRRKDVGSKRANIEYKKLKFDIMKTKQTSIQQQIFDLESELISAMKSSDVSSLDKLLHDDLLFITPDGQTITKKMDLDSHGAGNMIVEVFISNSDAINVFDDTAISISTIETKGKMLGQPIDGFFKYIRVWKLAENNWKIIGGSCSQL